MNAILKKISPDHARARRARLLPLLTELEKAKVGSLELDAKIYLATEHIKFKKQETWNAPIPLDEYARQSVDAWQPHWFTRKLGAAVLLVPKDDCGGWFWRVGFSTQHPGWSHLNRYHPDHCDVKDEVTTYAATPELSLTISALKAWSNIFDISRP